MKRTNHHLGRTLVHTAYPRIATVPKLDEESLAPEREIQSVDFANYKLSAESDSFVTNIGRCKQQRLELWIERCCCTEASLIPIYNLAFPLYNTGSATVPLVGQEGKTSSPSIQTSASGILATNP